MNARRRSPAVLALLCGLSLLGTASADESKSLAGVWSFDTKDNDQPVLQVLVLYESAQSLVGITASAAAIAPIRVLSRDDDGAILMSWRVLDAGPAFCVKQAGDRLALWPVQANRAGDFSHAPCQVTPPATAGRAQRLAAPRARWNTTHWRRTAGEAAAEDRTFTVTRYLNRLRGRLESAAGAVEYDGIAYGDRFLLRSDAGAGRSEIVTGQLDADRLAARGIGSIPGAGWPDLRATRTTVRGTRISGPVDALPLQVATGRWRVTTAAGSRPSAFLELQELGTWVVGQLEDASGTQLLEGERSGTNQYRLRTPDRQLEVAFTLSNDVLDGTLVGTNNYSQPFRATRRGE